MVPPLPAVSRPSKTMQTLAPVAFTHSCMATSSPCRTRISFSYRFLFILCFMPASSRGAGDECGTTFAPVDLEDSSAPLCLFLDFLPIWWSHPFLWATEGGHARSSYIQRRELRKIAHRKIAHRKIAHRKIASTAGTADAQPLPNPGARARSQTSPRMGESRRQRRRRAALTLLDVDTTERTSSTYAHPTTTWRQSSVADELAPWAPIRAAHEHTANSPSAAEERMA
jgi:hypothetical protein